MQITQERRKSKLMNGLVGGLGDMMDQLLDLYDAMIEHFQFK